MSNSQNIRASGTLIGVLVSLFCGCVPLHNLDKAVGGRSGTTAVASSARTVIDGGTTRPSGGTGGSKASSAANGGTVVDAAQPADASTSQGGTATAGAAGAGAASGGMGGWGGMAGQTLSTSVGGTGGRSISTGSVVGGTAGGLSGGVAGATVAGGNGGDAGAGSCSFAPDLPDIVNSPVPGKIAYSAGASWDIDGVQVPAFEIHTPTASYWLVKSAAAMVSITDTAGVQWINFSSGFRPNRGVPNLGGCCQPGDPRKLGLPAMTTEVDPSFTMTSTHLRLISKSDNGSYQLVWDFFLTHVTLTVNCAEKAFGFTYRGAPAGAIHAADRLVLGSGESLTPSSPHSGDLSGDAEWVHYVYAAGKHSLFLIQHTGDAITDSYQIADGDTAMWVFGGDQSKKYLTKTPIRFSLGLMDSAEDAAVAERIRFVISAIR